MAAMSTRAELSALATGLAELAGRLELIAEGLVGDEQELVGPSLFEIERVLAGAQRRLLALLDR